MMWRLLLCLLTVFTLGAGSRSFDGTNDEISWGNNVDVTTGDWTGCAWTKLTENAASDAIISKRLDGAAGNPGYFLHQLTGDTIRLHIDDGTTRQSTTGQTTDIDGAWFWICGWFDGSSGDDARAYIDGVEEATDNFGTIGSITTTEQLRTGEMGDGGDDLAGLVGMMQVWTAALTTDEMIQVMYLPGTVVDSLGLFAPYWGDSTEVDLSGNGLTGTVSNATTAQDGPPVGFGMFLPL